MPRRPWSQAQLGYLAGIVDGEGTIEARLSSARPNRKGDRSINNMQLRILVSNTDVGLMLWLKATFGGTIRTTKPGGTVRCPRPLFRWQVGIRSNRDLVDELLPLLVIKQKQLELALEMASLAIRRGRGYCVPPDNASRRLEIAEEIKALRRAG